MYFDAERKETLYVQFESDNMRTTGNLLVSCESVEKRSYFCAGDSLDTGFVQFSAGNCDGRAYVSLFGYMSVFVMCRGLKQAIY